MKRISDDGWHDSARKIQSPNQDERSEGTEPELLVVHGISLPPGHFGGSGVEELFLNKSTDPALSGTKVSAHFFIRRDGELLQFVPCARRAWHAGESMWDSRQACNDFSVGVEIEGTDDLPYSDEQYATLCDLVVDLKKALPSLCAIAGHCDISSGRKTDPGASFDWKRLFDRVGIEMDGRRK